MNNVTPVTLCGGSGTRFWPLSRAGFRKQFLVLSGTTSLFEQAAELVSQLGANYTRPRRGETFVIRKITRGLANIAQGLEQCLYTGNFDALRDWGHAKDYVRMQ